MEIVLLKPTESPRTQTLRLVDSYDVEYGDENTVHVTYKDNSRDTFTGIGYCVRSATTTVNERNQ